MIKVDDYLPKVKNNDKKDLENREIKIRNLED